MKNIYLSIAKNLLKNVNFLTIFYFCVSRTIPHCQNMTQQFDVLHQTNMYAVQRKGRFLLVELYHPSLVLSTSFVNGGLNNHLSYLVNHQSCEGKAHKERYDWMKELSQAGYHDWVCQELNLPSSKAAMMGTAAQMQYAGIQQSQFEEVHVCAIVTAGISNNSGRAGDPALWHEREGNYIHVSAIPGTINTILLFNQSLSNAAITRSAATMTEAKSAALAELAIPSRYSSHLATGTGTDQFCIASPQTSAQTYTWTGKHTKLGELVGSVVLEATKEAIRWQNGLEPSLTRSLTHALARHNCQEAQLKTAITEQASEVTHQMILENWDALISDPQVSGCAYAIAAIEDRLQYGTLPLSTRNELLANQCALLAAAVSGKPENIGPFRDQLLRKTLSALANWIGTALIIGWENKWN
ncbi:MAG: adenosylcobinamide amidohydrolase [SAR324 cluster bacterium]|nr:adenosylcobinamide amidohydrolase [SAR324 cluster bacterium]